MREKERGNEEDEIGEGEKRKTEEEKGKKED